MKLCNHTSKTKKQFLGKKGLGFIAVGIIVVSLTATSLGVYYLSLVSGQRKDIAMWMGQRGMIEAKLDHDYAESLLSDALWLGYIQGARTVGQGGTWENDSVIPTTEEVMKKFNSSTNQSIENYLEKIERFYRNDQRPSEVLIEENISRKGNGIIVLNGNITTFGKSIHLNDTFKISYDTGNKRQIYRSLFTDSKGLAEGAFRRDFQNEFEKFVCKVPENVDKDRCEDKFYENTDIFGQDIIDYVDEYGTSSGVETNLIYVSKDTDYNGCEESSSEDYEYRCEGTVGLTDVKFKTYSENVKVLTPRGMKPLDFTKTIELDPEGTKTINLLGEILWKYEYSDGSTITSISSSNNNIFIDGDNGYNVVAIERTGGNAGTEDWRSDTQDESEYLHHSGGTIYDCSPTYDDDSGDGYLTVTAAQDDNGDKKWTAKKIFEGYPYSIHTVNGETVYSGGQYKDGTDGRLVVLRDEGSDYNKINDYETSFIIEDLHGFPKGSYSSGLYDYNYKVFVAGGSDLWSVHINSSDLSSENHPDLPNIGETTSVHVSDGTLYAGGDDGKIFAINISDLGSPEQAVSCDVNSEKGIADIYVSDGIIHTAAGKRVTATEIKNGECNELWQHSFHNYEADAVTVRDSIVYSSGISKDSDGDYHPEVIAFEPAEQ